MIYKIETKIYIFLLSIFVVILDQYTKYLIIHNFKSYLNKDFILFNIDYVKNYGAAFNILSGSRIFLSIVSIIFSIILVYLILKKTSSSLMELYAYGLILGGTIGNGIDRIVNGFVIDFINIKIVNFPIFNIADISINIGFIFLFYSIFKNNK